MRFTRIVGSSLYSDAVEVMTMLAARDGRLPEMAEVAGCLAVSEAELSDLFQDETQLLEAMVETAMMRLHDRCVRMVVKVADQDPIAQFSALADAYLEWACDHPREFRIIGAMPASRFETNERLMRFEHALHDLMYRLLNRARREGLLAGDDDLNMLIAVAHTFSYGVVSKMMLGDLSRWSPGLDGLEAARRSMQIFIQKMLVGTA